MKSSCLIMQILFMNFNIRLVVVLLLAYWHDQSYGSITARWSVLNEEIIRTLWWKCCIFIICWILNWVLVWIVNLSDASLEAVIWGLHTVAVFVMIAKLMILLMNIGLWSGESYQYTKLFCSLVWYRD